MNEDNLAVLDACAPWHAAYEIQRDTIVRFHDLCAEVLGAGCAVKPLDDETLDMKRNLFSTLFIMATAALDLSEEKVRFYAVVNHCLRSLVTGCDNILDNEYKEVIPFDLSGKGFKFRSVLHIMTADAVLLRLVTQEIEAGRLTPTKAARLSHAVLAVLIPIGVGEYEEESHLLRGVPTPSQIIDEVLYRKTGLLFQAPLKLVEQMGDAAPEKVFKPAEALTDFGIGCQILDESMDVAEDVRQGRPNLVLSLAFHGENSEERDIAQAAIDGHEELSEARAIEIAGHLAHSVEECRLIAVNYFIHAYRAFAEAVPEFTPDAAFALATLVQKAILKDSWTPLLGVRS